MTDEQGKRLCNSEEGCPNQEGAYCKDGPLDCVFAERRVGPGGLGANTYGAKPEPELESAPELIGEQLAEEAGIVEPIAITALIKIEPIKDPAIFGLLEEAAKLQEYAEALVVQNDGDIKSATNDLTIIQGLRKKIAEKQKEYLDPINQHINDVRQAFKLLLDPLSIADDVTREKILAYRDEIRKRQEAEAEAARLRQQAAELEAEAKGETPPEPEVLTPTVHQAKMYRSGIGNLSAIKNVKFEVVDFSLLPDDYKLPDNVKIRKVITAGASIPGVKVWLEESLRVNSKGGEQ